MKTGVFDYYFNNSKIMSKPLLIILLGPVSSGKSTIGKKISKELSLPFINKDDLKEVIFNSSGWKDKKYSKKVGKEAYAILYYCINCILSIFSSVIVEANFTSKLSSKKIKDLLKKHNASLVQLNCWTKKGVLAERFKERNKLGIRHPGHCEDYIFKDIKDSLKKGRVDVLDIKGSILEIETTDLDKIDYKSIIKKLKSKVDKV